MASFDIWSNWKYVMVNQTTFRQKDLNKYVNKLFPKERRYVVQKMEEVKDNYQSIV